MASVLLSAVALGVLGVACGASGSEGSAAKSLSEHKTCVAGASGTTLAQFQSLVGFQVNCADVYDDAASTWQQWDSPWFIDNHISADNWSPFAAKSGNQMIITLTMIPDSIAKANWVKFGAEGKYTAYAKTLARNLVKGHMGSAVIRLATEANGTWEKDSVGTTKTQMKQWIQFWRKTVQAMRSVSGANFAFDWCIANGYRNLPFKDYYPGNDVVDEIGVDVYDQVPSGTSNRFGYLKTESGGLNAIAAFARSRGKPLTIGEWGLDPTSDKGAGDDPSFVKSLAQYVASTPVASESYFFDGGPASTLAQAPQSLAVYKAAFNPDKGTVVAKQ